MNNQIELKPQSRHSSDQKTTRTVLYILAIFFVTGGMFSCKNNNDAKNQEQGRVDSVAAIKDTLQNQYNAARMQIDNDATKSAQLDSMIREKDRQIAALRSTNGRLEKSNKKMANELKADKKLIASLKQDLNDSSKSFEDRLAALENDRNDLVRQRDSLLSKYNKILALGSVLHASNIRLEAIHLKHHGTKEKDTKRARKADELRVEFDIDENRIAENGTKKLYLVITDPAGKLLSNTESGVTNASNGTQLNYTLLKEIPLITNEPVKDIVVDWHQEGDYEKGTYTIAIYNGGYRIGGGSVELK